MSFNSRDLEFLYEIGSLRNIERGWKQHLGIKCASVLEHTMRVVFISLILGRREGSIDEEKLIKMALVHDLVETRTGELSYVQKVYSKTDDDKAARDMFKKTTIRDLYSKILKEYEERRTLEAKIVKDADNLDVDIELREIKEKGFQAPKAWYEMRKMVRDKKLYTNSAKELWDMLDKVAVADWHTVANKWIKMPKTGR
jgi:putative hydrolases of HD superfamily